MTYTEYIRERVPKYKDPTVTISSTGNADISKSAQGLFGEHRYVRLFYDKENGRIAIKPVSAPSGNTVTIMKKGYGWRICMVGFVNHFGIKACKYKAVHNESLGMIELILDEADVGEDKPVEEPSSTQHKRRSRADKPIASIGKSSNVFFNVPATTLISQYKYVTLSYHPLTQRIRLNMLKERCDKQASLDVKTISRHQASGGSSVCIASFLKEHGINKQGKFNCVWDKEAQALYIQLGGDLSEEGLSGKDNDAKSDPFETNLIKKPEFPDPMDKETIEKYVAKAKVDYTAYQNSRLPETLAKIGKQMAARQAVYKNRRER